MRYFKRFWPVVPALAGGLALVLVTTSPVAAVDIATCPFTITSPGVYDVATDLACAGDGIVILSGASGALLRLNGHTLTGPNNGLGTGIYVDAAAGVNIQGPGVVRQFAVAGIYLSSATGIVVQGVTAKENVDPAGFGVGFFLYNSNGNQILGCTSSENRGPDGDLGMWLNNSSGNVLINATVTDEDDGIFVTGSSVANQIIASNISNFTTAGIYLYAGTRSNTLAKNTVSNGGPSSFGIASNGLANAIQGNTANNNQYGIYVGPSGHQNIVVANTAVGNTTWDLRDNHSDCDSNVWAANTFGTSSQACIH